MIVLLMLMPLVVAANTDTTSASSDIINHYKTVSQWMARFSSLESLERWNNNDSGRRYSNHCKDSSIRDGTNGNFRVFAPDESHVEIVPFPDPHHGPRVRLETALGNNNPEGEDFEGLSKFVSVAEIAFYWKGEKLYPSWRSEPTLVSCELDEERQVLIFPSDHGNVCPPILVNISDGTVSPVEITSLEERDDGWLRLEFVIGSDSSIDDDTFDFLDKSDTISMSELSGDHEMFGFLNSAKVRFGSGCIRKSKWSITGVKFPSNEDKSRSKAFKSLPVPSPLPAGCLLSHFVPIHWAVPGTVRPCPLSVYPGSGSKWVLEMVEMATGFAAEIECFVDEESFPHDCAENYRLGLVSYETSVLPRLHHPQHGIHFDPGKRNNSGVALRTQHIASFGGRAVVLIRNPFDAIISWWNHRLSGGGKFHGMDKSDLRRSLHTDEFCSFASVEIGIWKEMILDWVLLGEDILVSHYEHFLEDRITELRRILDFIGASEDDFQDRLACIKSHQGISGRHNRKGLELSSDPYCPGSRSLMDEAMDKVDSALALRGHRRLPRDLYRQFKMP